MSWDFDFYFNVDLEKVLIVIFLDLDKYVLWGYFIFYEFGQICWFKFFLIDKNDFFNDVQNFFKIVEVVVYLEKYNKFVIDIVSFYFCYIWNYVIQ